MGDKEALSFRSRSEVDQFLQTPRFNQLSSPFYYRSWKTINPHVRTERDTTVVNPSYGGQFLVELEKDKTKVGKFWFKIVRSALTATGGGTFARYQDGEGFAMFSELELLHGEYRVNTLTDEQMFLQHRSMHPDDQARWGDNLYFIDLPTATRTALGAASQTLYVPYKHPLTDDARTYISVQSLGSKLAIRGTLRNLNEITETDGTSVPTSSSLSITLRTINYHFSDQEKAFHNNLSLAAGGVVYRVQEWSPLKKIDIATGVESTEVEFEMRGMTGAASEVAFGIYDTANRDATAPNPINARYTYNAITSFRAFISSTRVIPPQEHKWNLHQHQPTYYIGANGDNLYRWSFSENIEDPMAIWGHQGLSQAHPLRLFITFNSVAVSNTWELRCYIRRNNFIKHSGATLQRLVH